jgi:transcriptional regulator with XRE-family HTH domain
METANNDETKKKKVDVPESSREFGKRLRLIRKTLKATQLEMAEKLNIAPSYMSEIENGKANPNYYFFFLLTNRFKVSLDFLFHGKGEMFLNDEIVPEETENKYVDEIESIDDLIWLIKRSSIFRLEMLSHGGRFLIEKEETIKKNIARREAKRDKVQSSGHHLP